MPMPNGTFRVRDIGGVIDLAIASGRFTEARRDYWHGRLTTPEGPAARGAALLQLLNLAPLRAASPARTSDVASPLLASYRESHGELVQMAEASGQPAPVLFPGSGGVPPFTASGIDPQAVANLPWQARRPVSEMTDRGQALAAVQEYSGPDGDTLAAMDYTGHASNREYAQQMRAWLSGTATAGLPPHTRSQPAAIAAAGAMDDDTVYQRLFG